MSLTSSDRIRVKFNNDFQASYIRGQQFQGVKALKCFPQCGNTRAENSYCGVPLILTFTVTDSDEDDDPLQDLSRIIAIAEFKHPEEQFTITSPTSIDRILSIQNSSTNPTFPLYFGSISGVHEHRTTAMTLMEQEIVIAFNDDRRNFHHSWDGDSRCNGPVQRVFGVTLLIKQLIRDPQSGVLSELLCPITHFSSPSFMLFPMPWSSCSRLIPLIEPELLQALAHADYEITAEIASTRTDAATTTNTITTSTTTPDAATTDATITSTTYNVAADSTFFTTAFLFVPACTATATAFLVPTAEDGTTLDTTLPVATPVGSAQIRDIEEPPDQFEGWVL